MKPPRRGAGGIIEMTALPPDPITSGRCPVPQISPWRPERDSDKTPRITRPGEAGWRNPDRRGSAMTDVATVFGGSGFIGRYVVRRLARAGKTVRVAVRDTEGALFLKTAG